MRVDIEKLYYNFEHLEDNYVDLDGVKEKSEKLNNYLEGLTGNLFTSKSIYNMEPYITELCCENEKQGFIYGFEYAVKLLTLSGQKMEE